MSELLIVFGLALLPELGHFAGASIAEWFQTSPHNLNRALHAAAGIVIAIVAVELMPEALASLSGWIVGLAFGLGGVAYIGLDVVVERLQQRGADSSDRTGMWMIYIAVAIDLFSDGLMIGAGSAVSSALALTLALGQVLADVPEGYAAVANFKDKGVPRRQRVLLAASFAVTVLLAAALAFFLLRGQAEAVKLGTLVFTAGLLTVAAVEDMISEAHEAAEDTRASILAFVGGFVLFTLVSAGLGR
jgi:ZIP family zinc transporter